MLVWLVTERSLRRRELFWIHAQINIAIRTQPRFRVETRDGPAFHQHRIDAGATEAVRSFDLLTRFHASAAAPEASMPGVAISSCAADISSGEGNCRHEPARTEAIMVPLLRVKLIPTD